MQIRSSLVTARVAVAGGSSYELGAWGIFSSSFTYRAASLSGVAVRVGATLGYMSFFAPPVILAYMAGMSFSGEADAVVGAEHPGGLEAVAELDGLAGDVEGRADFF